MVCCGPKTRQWIIITFLCMFVVSAPIFAEINASEISQDREPTNAKGSNLPTTEDHGADIQTTATGIKARLAIDLGLRQDNLDWNIAGDRSGNNPNILSELTWENLESYQLGLSGHVDIGRRLRLKGAVAYATIYEGKNQDSDYAGDNRTLEFSRSNNSADDGQLWDLSVGIGPRFDFGLAYFRLIPMVGYSYHAQHLTITDGVQTIDASVEPDLGPISGLDSTYETRWHGPWLGVAVEIDAMQPLWFFRDVRFDFYMEYHWADYYAEADWNLRTDFRHPLSFSHDADGTGMIYGLGTTLFMTRHLALSIRLDYVRWETDDGIDRVYFADGSEGTTRLNRVRWDAQMFSVGISYHF